MGLADLMRRATLPFLVAFGGLQISEGLQSTSWSRQMMRSSFLTQVLLHPLKEQPATDASQCSKPAQVWCGGKPIIPHLKLLATQIALYYKQEHKRTCGGTAYALSGAPALAIQSSLGKPFECNPYLCPGAQALALLMLSGQPS